MATAKKTLSMSMPAKLGRAAVRIGSIPKDGKNEFHKYKYTSASAVMNKVRSALAEENIWFISTELEKLRDEWIGKKHFVAIKIKYVLQNDGDNMDKCIMEGIGGGTDSGDKAYMKAETAAMKYAFMLGLGLSWGDDPEADTSTDKDASMKTDNWDDVLLCLDSGEFESFQKLVLPMTPPGDAMKSDLQEAKHRAAERWSMTVEQINQEIRK